MRAVSGCGHIRRVEQLAGAQRVAGADAAVADAVDLVLAVNIRDLVHKAVFLGAFRENWLPFLGGLVLVVGLSALRLSALVNDLGFGIGTALYAFAAGALAISAMVLPGISGSSLLMSCGLCLPVIAAMKDLLHFQFGQFWLLAAVGLGLLAGFAIAPHCIRGWMRKAPGAVTYAVLGMMLSSLYAIVVGPTTLKVPQHAMTISDFHLLWFALGIAVMLGLEALKRRVQKALAH